MPAGKSTNNSAKGKKELAEPDPGVKRIPIWPEWTESEIAAEKFDTGGKGKDKSKAATGASVVLYEDPEGQPHLPPSLSGKLTGWKKPTEYYQQVFPVVVYDNQTTDLISCNEHLFTSKLMSTIISELNSLIYLSSSLPSLPQEPDAAPLAWQPWHHICPWPKGTPAPVFNTLGKYCIKLYWMGSWRKVTVDDSVPVDSEDQLLLPVTPLRGELWPILITKGLLKIINLECTDSECPVECSVVEMLTGWVCESSDIGCMEEVWSMITKSLKLSEWIRPAEDETTDEEGGGGGGGGTDTSSRDSILLVNFTSSSAELLKRCGLSFIDPTHPILMTQWKAEPLELPPKEPPLPSLQAPYYLGLKERKHEPWLPPPPPVKTDHRSFQLYSPFNNTSSLMWIDLDDFVAIFKELRIFRKPESFQYHHSSSELSLTAPNSAIPPTAGSVKKGSSNTQIAKVPVSDIIFVDSSGPVSLLISYSSINCWYEGGNLIGTVPLPSLGFHKPTPPQPVEADANKPHPQTTPLNDDQTVLGSIQVEAYNWKEYCGGCTEPLLAMRIRATKAKSINLPKGRHTLKLHMTGTYGYHVAVYSDTKFTLTDEDGVLPLLNAPSEGLVLHSKQVFDSLMNAARLIEDHDQYQELVTTLVSDHLSRGVQKNHIHAIRAGLLHTFHLIGPHCGLNNDHLFAWKSFINQLMIQLADGLLPDDEEVPPMRFEEMRNLKFAERPTLTEEELLQIQDDITISEQETLEILESTSSSHKRQQLLKGMQKLSSIHDSIDLDRGGGGGGGEEKEVKNTSTVSKKSSLQDTPVLSKKSSTDTLMSRRSSGKVASNKSRERQGHILSSLPLLQSQSSLMSMSIFTCLFAIRPDLLDVFHFGEDEYGRAHYKNISIGPPVPSLEPNKWAVLFRSVFTVQYTQDLVFRLHGSLKRYLIKIINNDDMSEVICGLPYSVSCTVQPNKSGYTLLCEMWSLKESVDISDKLHLTMISSSSHLPTFSHETSDDKLSTDFHTTAIRNYYLPDRYYTMLRYNVKVTAVCHVTIQLDTSKPNVLFKLEVLDRGVAIISREGCGHCVIPSVNLLPSKELKEDEEEELHHYIISVSVLHDTWPVAESSWQYISLIKSIEKEDKPSSAKKTKGRDKGTKTPKAAAGGDGGGKGGATPTQPIDNIDATKPHWTLRIVTESDNSNLIKVAKDNEKEETQNNLVKAWDTEQPGRSQKAQQSRQKFLETHAAVQKEDTTQDGDLASDTAASVCTTVTGGTESIPSFGPVALKTFDTSKYTEGTSDIPQFADEAYESEQDRIQKERIERYREWRQKVMETREADLVKRENMKRAQLRKARKIQMILNSTRERLNVPREEMRNKHLLLEQQKQEALAAERAREEAIVSAGKDSKRKSPKGKKK